tara:strand:- start:956 stop:1366 length:411 start_codon:yes stop_codon:yes gene_type:complete
MLPSLARLPQQPTGAQLASDKFKATARFIRGNPDRASLKVDSEGAVSDEDMAILTLWVIRAFRSTIVNSNWHTRQWTPMSDIDFDNGVAKLRCSGEHWATTFGYNGRYEIERDELVITDTNGAKTWNLVVAVTPRG